jgi:NTE family protein
MMTELRCKLPLLHLLKSLLFLAIVLVLIAVWFSTARTRPYMGEPLPQEAGWGSEHAVDATPSNRSKDLLVFVGFSGGGTRAAALAYGVLQELAATKISTSSGSRRVLDEVDVISSVSGGSFTNAYFGLFGDGIFEDFKEAMLLRPIESDLLKELANPGNWRNIASPYFGRSDLAADYYDEHIFKGKTFADIDPSTSPWIIINASDISTGKRLVFTRHIFELLCLNYDMYPVARAVAASSGVPGATTPIALKNHAGSCGYTLPDRLIKPLKAEKHPMLAVKIKGYLDYLDAKKRPWLHLVDGGITDNLGLREFYTFTTMAPEFAPLFDEFTGDQVNEVLMISVNAAVEHRHEWANQPENPSERDALGAMTHIQMRNYTTDTLHIVKETYRDWQKERKQSAKPAHFEFVEIAFSALQDEEEKAYLNTLPTSMQLSEEQVDKLIDAGRRLLRDSPSFQQFLSRHRPEVAPDN